MKWYNLLGDTMLEKIKNITILNVIQGKSVLQNTIKDRFSHVLVFKISGESAYVFQTETISLAEDEVLFIPKGASYSIRRLSDESEYVYINFEAELCAQIPQIYSFRGFKDKLYLYHNLQKLWLLGTEAERYKCYALFYEVLAFLTEKTEPQYAFLHKYKLIEPAVRYIKSELFSCDLKVEDLCALCGMSDTYFRNIFKAVYGQTPRDYIMNTRLSYAAGILISGEYDSIKALSESVGYPDALYFSRIFLKKYGVRPSAYGKNV